MLGAAGIAEGCKRTSATPWVHPCQKAINKKHIHVSKCEHATVVHPFQPQASVVLHFASFPSNCCDTSLQSGRTDALLF